MSHFAILRVQKLKSAISVHRSLKHAFREQETPNADPAKAAQNVHLGARSSAEAMSAFRSRLPEKRRKDAVLAIEYLVTASPEAMSKLTPLDYFNDALVWLKNRHGASNVVYSGLHYDEKTPHMYAYVVPLDESSGRLNARKWLGGATALSAMQSDFAVHVGARHGLERGIKGSKAKHERVQRHYSLVNSAAAQLSELGMLDRASLGVGKPTARAAQALEAGDSKLTMSHEFSARKAAVKQREQAIVKREKEHAVQHQRIVDAEAIAALAVRQVATARRELAAAKLQATRSDEMADNYRRCRDEAIDELRELSRGRSNDFEP